GWLAPHARKRFDFSSLSLISVAQHMDRKKTWFSVSYVIIALWGVLLFQLVISRVTQPTEIPYSEFKAAVEADKVAEVSGEPAIIHGRTREAAPTEPQATPSTSAATADGTKGGRVFDTVRIEDPDLLRDLAQHNVKVTGIIENTFLRDML